MRKLLNGLYTGAAAMAAVCMVGLLLSVLALVVGRQLGWYVNGLDAYSGYLMAAAGFMALAHTFKKGEHIRVTLIINALGLKAKRALELWSLLAASALAVLLAFYSARLVWQSWTFHDISTGNDATPLWIPQLAMASGTLVFAIALLDELILELRGQREITSSGDMLRNE
jgi:TRAP-type C4-dicarboxylate transport system permease small subunit